MVLISATFWGLSGTVAQALFQHHGFRPPWLVSVRMMAAGLGLLVASGIRQGFGPIRSVFDDPKDRLRVLIFGLAGLLPVQYTYFAAIEDGTATSATLLQYLGPMLIVLYEVWRHRRMPDRGQSVSMVLAMTGTWLLISDGSWHALIVPVNAVAWGLLSALALAFYTVYPRALLRRFGSAVIVGWGMFIGGLGFMVIAPPWAIGGQQWSWTSLGMVAFVVVLGTLVAFYLYLASLRWLDPATTSLLACAEPLAAAGASMLWLHVRLTFLQELGGLAIILGVMMLAASRNPSGVPLATEMDEGPRSR